MPLDPSLVSYALGLAHDEPSSGPVVENLAIELENREELFAYLFTRTKILELHPDLRELIKQLSDSYGSQPSSHRPTIASSAQLSGLQRELEQVLLEIVQTQSTSNSILKRAEELQSIFSSARYELNSPQVWIETQPISLHQKEDKTL